MANLGKLAKQAKALLDKQGDRIASAVDKTTDVVDKKTKGKYTAKLDKVDDLAKKLDKTEAGGGAPEAPADGEATPET